MTIKLFKEKIMTNLIAFLATMTTSGVQLITQMIYICFIMKKNFLYLARDDDITFISKYILMCRCIILDVINVDKLKYFIFTTY